MTKTIEDFRFLADNKCAGIEVDVLRGHWATQGPEYYLMAQLTYDPYQDGVAALLKKAQQAKASPPRKIGAPPSKM